ncbi:MAG: putative small lipoprotein YifL [Rickettsiales bacterium]|jgi:predicted small lipoprotein YifL
MKKSFLLLIILGLSCASCGKRGALYLTEEQSKEGNVNEEK